MRLAHVLVLMLSCGCSLDTRPLSAGAVGAVRASEPQNSLVAVSFESWRRADWGAQPDAAAADGGKPLRTQVSSDAAVSEPQPMPPARASADNLRPPLVLHTPAADSAGANAVDAAVPLAAEDGADAGPGAAGAAASPSSQPLPAGAGPVAGAAAGQGGVAADGGMPAPAVADAAIALLDAGAAEDSPAQRSSRTALLELVQQTLDTARTPDARSLAATVRSLLERPESERTGARVAEVLVRMGSVNACRFDNPEDCAELCSALARDCSVCRWDTSCQLSVQLMCATQRGFSCDVWR